VEVLPLAADSMGTRSMATLVRTDDLVVLIDPGVALAPRRYGLPPHPLEFLRMEEHREAIIQASGEADVLIVTHYHYDHHMPDVPEIFKGKVALIKHPTENINRSQRGRAAYFLGLLEGLPRRLEAADGREFKFGRTRLAFSKAVYHGTGPRLGYVIEVCVECGGEKFAFTSDVEGPALEDQVEFILAERPELVYVDGPMTYMLGFRYSARSLQASVENLIRVLEAGTQTLVVDHHFLRDLAYRERIGPVYEFARERGAEVLTAAELAGKPIEMLEAHRKELYEQQPP